LYKRNSRNNKYKGNNKNFNPKKIMTKEETFEDMLQKALKDGKDNNREMKKVMRRKLKTIDSS